MTELEKLMAEYADLLNQQSFDEANLDYTILDYHLPLLQCFDVVDNGCISVFDMYKRTHLYYSPKYYDMLGWDPERAMNDINYTNSLIHKEDRLNLYKTGLAYMALGFALPDKRISRDYKCISEYRVIGKEGKYVRVIEQHVPLEFDKSGNIWLALSMLDLSPDQDLNAPFRSRLKNQRTGEFYVFPMEEEEEKILKLTHREKEVLQLIARGLISKEIADKLCISVNTVNTHRQRIIEKLNVSNTYQAIQYGHNNGLF